MAVAIKGPDPFIFYLCSTCLPFSIDSTRLTRHFWASGPMPLPKPTG